MSEIKIDIPQQLIDDTIRAEIVRQVSKDNREALVKAVVEKAMSTTDRYERETLFQKSVREMIIETAKEIFEEWLRENRNLIKQAIITYLNEDKQKRLTEFAESLAKNIQSYGVDVKLHLGNFE